MILRGSHGEVLFLCSSSLTGNQSSRMGRCLSRLSPIELVLSKGKTKQTGSLLSHQIKGGCDKRRNKYSWAVRRLGCLFFVKWLLATSLKLTESIIGLFTLIVGAGIVYYLICKRWSDVFLMSLIFAAIIVVLLAVITIQDWCDALIEKIGAL